MASTTTPDRYWRVILTISNMEGEHLVIAAPNEFAAREIIERERDGTVDSIYETTREDYEN